jgi:hypothetical protein
VGHYLEGSKEGRHLGNSSVGALLGSSREDPGPRVTALLELFVVSRVLDPIVVCVHPCAVSLRILAMEHKDKF